MKNCCMKFKIAKRAKYIPKLKRATSMPNMTCCADILKYIAVQGSIKRKVREIRRPFQSALPVQCSLGVKFSKIPWVRLFDINFMTTWDTVLDGRCDVHGNRTTTHVKEEILFKIRVGTLLLYSFNIISAIVKRWLHWWD